GVPCNAQDTQTCGRVAGAILEPELSFGVTEGIEITTLARFGLEDHPIANSKPLAFGAGIRAYPSPRSMFKFFLGVKGIVDVTSSNVANWSGTDFGIRPELG